MARTHVQLIQDVLYEVFPYLDPDHYASREEVIRARQTLLRSAITCKDFTWPALNILWQSLPSDKPLLGLLSTYGIVERGSVMISGAGVSHLDDCYTLCSNSDPRAHPHWHRLQQYASRVRKITLTLVRLPEWSVWRDIVSRLEGDHILPSLQVVSIQADGCDAGDTGALLLISPSVRELSVSAVGTVNTDPGLLQNLFREACRFALRLDRLHIGLAPHAYELDALHSHQDLRIVTIAPEAIYVIALQHLTHLAILETLSVSIIAKPAVPLHFQALRDVKLKGDWENIESFLDNTTLPSLERLLLSVGQFDPTLLGRDCTRCLWTLATKLPHITSLSVDCRQHYRLITEPPIPTGGILASMVEPLLSLHALRTVALRFHNFIVDYTSADIRAFAGSWPDLEMLDLELSTHEPDGHRAGFESVVHFAHYCPRLHVLRLPAMDLSPHGLAEVVYPPISHPLREMDVARVVFAKNVDLSAGMTEFVKKVFPFAAAPLVEFPIVVTDEESGDRSHLV